MTEPSHNDQAEDNPPEQERWRAELDEARAERDALADLVSRMRGRELERLAAQHLAVPGDLLALTGTALGDYLDDAGDIDPAKVQGTARGVLASRPGLAPQTPATDRTQGHGTPTAPSGPDWGALLASGTTG
ncbi:MAG: hypothetical protein ACRC20_07160 [Segniliparus sp.]|uniref:hypothetical protein n=1 Tax=Segniliparus sp. TaxID=2804064 RepID=UPI003F3381A1